MEMYSIMGCAAVGGRPSRGVALGDGCGIAKPKPVILDACRNNPFLADKRGTRGGSQHVRPLAPEQQVDLQAGGAQQPAEYHSLDDSEMKLPAGTTTISGHSAHSLKLSFGLTALSSAAVRGKAARFGKPARAPKHAPPSVEGDRSDIDPSTRWPSTITN